MDCKTCTKCGTEKPLEAFRTAKGGKYGRASRCRDCMNARRRELHAENPEKVRSRRKKWNDANKDKVRAMNSKQYHKDGGARILAWRKENADKVKLQKQRHYQKYKGTYLAAARARDLQILNSIPEGQKEAVNRIWLDCPEGYEVDHIYPMSKGGPTSVDNLCYLPMSLNRSKSNKLPEGKVLHELLLNHAIIPAIGGTTEDNRLK